MRKMKLQEVRELLDKYYEGKTSLQDESVLLAYFNSDNIDPELEIYRDEFRYYASMRNEKISDAVVEKISGKLIQQAGKTGIFINNIWSKVAAVFLLIATGYCSFMAGRNIAGKDESLSMIQQNLNKELTQLRETTAMLLLNETSSQERIKALVIASKLPHVKDEMIERVLYTLNYDESPSVRLSALDLLYYHLDLPKVKAGLVEALLNQDSYQMHHYILKALMQTKDPSIRNQLRELIKKHAGDSLLKDEIRGKLSV